MAPSPTGMPALVPTLLKRVKREEAARLLSEHYFAMRASYPDSIWELRKTIIENIENIVNGISVTEAFAVIA
ncbi:MAG: hypothetical protein E7K65_03185 [Pseudomonas sp.]|nr:hypothetical protein [Pseudomonas sp.]